MAVSDDDTPLFAEFSSAEARPEKSAHQVLPGETGSNIVRSSPDLPLHRMHEGRVVRPAGRMVIGSPAPIPTLEEILKETPMFSGRKPRRLGVLSGLVIALACVLAIGAAVGLTGVLNLNTSTARKAAPGLEEKTAAKQMAAQASPSHAQPSPPDTQVARIDAQPQRMVPESQPGGFLVNSISGYAGEPMAVQISLPHAPPEEYSFVMFRGLPAQIGMSAGFRLKESWAVSLHDLDGLVMQSTPEFEGKVDLEVLLIKGRDVPAESRTITVEVQKRHPRTTAIANNAKGSAGSAQVPSTQPQRTTPASPADNGASVKPAQHAAAALPAVSPQEEGPLLEKAAHLMESNDVASARLLFEHLARLGSARAALALGQTFDPAYFHMAEIRGMRPDSEKAKEWYKKAAEMGDQEASKRLSAMTEH